MRRAYWTEVQFCASAPSVFAPVVSWFRLCFLHAAGGSVSAVGPWANSTDATGVRTIVQTAARGSGGSQHARLAGMGRRVSRPRPRSQIAAPLTSPRADRSKLRWQSRWRSPVLTAAQGEMVMLRKTLAVIAVAGTIGAAVTLSSTDAVARWGGGGWGGGGVRVGGWGGGWRGGGWGGGWGGG